MALSEETSPIVLKGGPVVSLGALRLLWQLEADGFTLEVRAGRLYVEPRDQVMPADEVAIRLYRDELVALVRYCETVQ
jgi:hypothetical protein